VVVDGVEGEQSMLPVQWDVGWCGWPGWDRRERDFVRENELLGRVSAQESVGAVLRGDDVGAGGDVEVGLTGVAEPDAVPGAEFQVNRQVDGDGFGDAAAGCAAAAGGGGADRSAGVLRSTAACPRRDTNLDSDLQKRAPD
jgi:hypothetical protein